MGKVSGVATSTVAEVATVTEISSLAQELHPYAMGSQKGKKKKKKKREDTAIKKHLRGKKREPVLAKGILMMPYPSASVLVKHRFLGPITLDFLKQTLLLCHHIGKY